MNRSKKYEKLSDEYILELATEKLSDNDRYYVIQELEYRGIREEVKGRKLENLKKRKRPKTIGGMICFAIFFLFMLSRFGSRMFG